MSYLTRHRARLIASASLTAIAMLFVTELSAQAPTALRSDGRAHRNLS
jgi:hypothetical protein